MKVFPLINLYPISDRAVSSQEIQEYEFAKKMNMPVGPLRTQQTVNSPYEFVVHTLQNYGHSGVVNEFNRQLDKSTQVRMGKAAMPYLYAVPALHKYRDKPRICDLEAANIEITQHGSFMHPGQILFHGGQWPIHNNQIVTDKPFSTSFCPQIAAWHAYNALLPNPNPNPVILILRVSEHCNKKAYVFKNGGAGMANEREVLFEKGAVISNTQPVTQIQTASGLVSIIEASLQ
ncbi:hypothetical protein ACRTDL_16545 [Shewanella algae]|uniref:hypothetical protein n=1 Tax=Shewanella algae TaxID=38313 RepID=UPI003D7DC1A8